MTIRLTGCVTHDLRFPTSRELDGSDAMNPDPDYSAAYITLKTSQPDLVGNGLTFTIGRGNELCVAALESLWSRIEGLTLEEICADMAGFWRRVTSDSQMRWVGPEKGIIHMATGALVNAVWDLYAKAERKPLWQLISDMSPEQFVSCIDFRYLTDAITPAEAVQLLSEQTAGKKERIEFLRRQGYPSYTTSAGWLGYPDDKLRDLCRRSLERGWANFKIKVGRSLDDDIRRCRIIREEIGWDRRLMVDANQVWEVDEAITWMNALAEFKPWFIEEPTSPDDVLGHAAIARGISPILVATGEQCQNRIMFKQFMQAGGLQICQIDACRMGGVNEVLAVLLLAARFGIPVCPHAGGVGLCEYVRHFAMIDYICVSGTLEDRICEYADHLHQHFVHPLVMRDGHYIPPEEPGFSATMLPDSIEKYSFPDGAAWSS